MERELSGPAVVLAAQVGDGPRPSPSWRSAGEVVPRPVIPPRAEGRGDEAKSWWWAVLEQIPRRFRAHRLETVNQFVKRPEAQGEARAALADLLAGEALAVTLVGRSEAGKTSLAAALVALLVELAEEGRPEALRLLWSALWTDELALSRARASHKLGGGEAPLVARALEASLLVLDELGGPTVSGSDEALEVIWRRWQDERPTIITTGQTGDKLIQRYGSGVFTRLTKQNASRLIQCSEPPKKKPQQGALPLGE